MKKGSRVPKSLLVQMLKKLGLTMKRVTFMNRRMWQVSDGSYHASLQAVFDTYKRPKTKQLYLLIEPIIKKINRAIS